MKRQHSPSPAAPQGTTANRNETTGKPNKKSLSRTGIGWLLFSCTFGILLLSPIWVRVDSFLRVDGLGSTEQRKGPPPLELTAVAKDFDTSPYDGQNKKVNKLLRGRRKVSGPGVEAPKKPAAGKADRMSAVAAEQAKELNEKRRAQKRQVDWRDEIIDDGKTREDSSVPPPVASSDQPTERRRRRKVSKTPVVNINNPVDESAPPPSTEQQAEETKENPVATTTAVVVTRKTVVRERVDLTISSDDEAFTTKSLYWIHGRGDSALRNEDNTLVSEIFSGPTRPMYMIRSGRTLAAIWDFRFSDFVNTAYQSALYQLAKVNSGRVDWARETIEWYNECENAIEEALNGTYVVPKSPVFDDANSEVLSEPDRTRHQFCLCTVWRESAMIEVPEDTNYIFLSSSDAAVKLWQRDTGAAIRGPANISVLRIRMVVLFGRDPQADRYRLQQQLNNEQNRFVGDGNWSLLASGGELLEKQFLSVKPPGEKSIMQKCTCVSLMYHEGEPQGRKKARFEPTSLPGDLKIWNHFTFETYFKKPTDVKWGKKISRVEAAPK